MHVSRSIASSASGLGPTLLGKIRPRFALAAALGLSLLSSAGCSSAAKCDSDSSCPTGAHCDAVYRVCFANAPFRDSIAAGDSHTCAGTVAGEAKCWGANGDGRVGDGSLADRSVPTLVAGLTRVRSVATGSQHSCALIDDGAVQCWGRNQSGQVSGVPQSGNTASPARVASLSGVAALSLGGAHSCALTADGKVGCWGDNSTGQLGTATSSSAPVLVPLGTKVAVAIASGDAHACAATQDMRLYCWGSNADGQASFRLTDGKPIPPTDLGLSNVESVAAGQSHTCAVTADKKVLCWGANDKGQLGRAVPAGAMTDPAGAISMADVQAIAAGCHHTCALKTDGTVYCWGSNASGELGNGTTADQSTPSRVESLAAVEAIAAGCRHTCAYIHGGAVYCWGDGSSGQIGDGAQANRSSPVAVLY